jgi:predicted MPP superfamily phosphohydrolase
MKLEIGYNQLFEIRIETLFTNCPDNFSILYLSDLHFNKFSQNITTRISTSIEELNPTIIFFGGDYVDSKKGLIHLSNLTRSISHRQNIFAIAGNHDYYFGINEVKKIFLDNNVIWLENKSFNLNFRNTKIKIDGNFISKERSIFDFSILLLHKPIHINKFKDNYNLALAGHLHGCQFVFWKSKNKLYPGRFFYEWNILKMKLNNCQYYISKGLGDTLPIRYNCKRDILFIQATNNYKKT